MGVRQFGVKANAILSGICGSYGGFCASWKGVLLCLIGLGVGVFFGVGLMRVEQLEDISELWVEQGTRLIAEKEAYDEKFGGFARDGVVTITSAEGGPVANTRENLDALLVETNLIFGIGSGEVKMDVELPDGARQDFTGSNFCQRPGVPAVFLPTDVDGNSEQTNLYSNRYAALSICLSRAGQLINAETNEPVNPLSSLWGITEFPCFRSTVLDCFAEGEVGYPDELRVIQDVSAAIYHAKKTENPQYKECIETSRQQLESIMSIIRPNDARRLADLVIDNMDEFVVPLFFTWGYRWRPSYRTMTTEEIGDFLHQAKKNAADSNITSLRCAEENLPCCPQWNGIIVDVETYMGAFSTQGTINSVGAFRTAWLNWNENDATFAKELQPLGISSAEERLQLLMDWEQKLIDLFLPKYERKVGSGYSPGEESAGAQLDFFTTRSANDVIAEGSVVPWGLVIAGYCIMLAYATLTFFDWSRPFGRSNFINSRIRLSIFGILVITLGTISGYGAMGWFGVKLSPISNNLVPFLTLGLGLDDMFVILHGLTSPHRISLQALSVPEAMNHAVSVAGPSVILTSLTNIAAFLAASAVRIPALYLFCYQVAMTVSFNLLFLFLIYVPLCALDQRRVLNDQLDVISCGCFSELKKDGAEVSTEETKAPVGCEEEHAGKRNAKLLSDKVGNFGGRILAPNILLRGTLSKAITIVSFLALFVAMLSCSILYAESGLPLQDVALSDSYQYSYVALQEAYFTSYVSFLVTSEKTESFNDEAVQKAMLDQQASLQTAAFVSSNPTIRDSSWFADSEFSLLAFYNGQKGFDNLLQPIPRDDYYSTLAQWAVTAGVSFEADLWCYNGSLNEPVGQRQRISCAADDVSPLDALGTSSSTVKLGTTKQTFIQRDLVKTKDFVEAINSAREKCDALNVDGNHAFVYGYIFEFWEQYLNIWNNFYMIVGLALAAVAGIVLLFLFSIRITVLITVLILSTVIDTFGIMTLLGVKVNAISVGNYAVAVGIAVEFLAHYSHAFLISEKETRDERATEALLEMFSPATNGYLSTVFALLVVCGNKFPFIRTHYFGMLFVTVTLAYLHGMLLLPVLVSLVGPMRQQSGSISADGECIQREQIPPEATPLPSEERF